MATETFNPARTILSMEGATAVYREDFVRAVSMLARVAPQDAEDLVATAGEDERGYKLRSRDGFLKVFFALADEFLGDDEGGFYQMAIHVTRYERSAAALELWFHVRRYGAEAGGTWIRHMVVGIDADRVYADMGAPADGNETFASVGI